MLKNYRFFVLETALFPVLIITGFVLGGFLQSPYAESATSEADKNSNDLAQLNALVTSLNTHVTNLEINSVTLQQQIGYLQAANQNLEDEIKSLKNANQLLQQDLQDQENHYVSLENISRDVQGQMQTFQDQIGDLRRMQIEVVSSLQKQVSYCQMEVSSCRSEVSNLQNQLSNSRRTQ